MRGSHAKATRDANFSTRIPLRTTLRDTLAYWRENDIDFDKLLFRRNIHGYQIEDRRSTTKTGCKTITRRSTHRQDPEPRSGARVSSGSAMSVCRWRWCWPMPASRCSAWTSPKRRVKLLNAGKSDIDDIPDSVVKKAVAAGRFKATDDPSMIAKVDTISICVPTPLSKTKDPDVSYILDAVNAAKPFIKKGTLVVLESTTYPGTTEELILPILEAERDESRQGFLPRVLAGTSRSGESDLYDQKHAARGRRCDSGLHRGGESVLRADDPECLSGLVDQSGRDGQAVWRIRSARSISVW